MLVIKRINSCTKFNFPILKEAMVIPTLLGHSIETQPVNYLLCVMSTGDTHFAGAQYRNTTCQLFTVCDVYR